MHLHRISICCVMCAVILIGCHKQQSELDYDQSKYTELQPPFKSEVYVCLPVAVKEIEALGFDTSNLRLIVKEDSSTFLFAFGPKPPADTTTSDGRLIVVMGGAADVIVSRTDCKLLRSYMTQ